MSRPPKKSGAGTGQVGDARLDIAENSGAAVVRISGDWSIHAGFPSAAALLEKLPNAAPNSLVFDCAALGNYDSSLPSFLLSLLRHSETCGIVPDTGTLPPRVSRLLALSAARPKSVSAAVERIAATPAAARAAVRQRLVSASVFERIGVWSISSVRSWDKALDFIGQTTRALFNLFRGRARTRFRECWFFIQASGADALPIVSLISFLTGLILAYVGYLQMQQVGATVYVAPMVSLAMMREMGVLMASVILCGRTATAYAAQLGSMQVSEEIAALRVLGVPPVEYLVLPRLIALVFTLPVLTLYADFCGILGGLLVGSSMGVTLDQSLNMMERVMTVPNVTSGVIKSVFFAVLIAWAGCFRGMVCGKSAQAVGNAATSAAVLGITLVIIADAVFAVLFNAINFF
ncbi:MAG: ABC transporter permease [Puniceicoccales bacterium]|nr:ABC transporter permease [Puniceicoccales bacterium]